MLKFITKNIERYFSLRVILLIDILVSLLGSMLALFLFGLISQQNSKFFSVEWLSLSVLFSFAAFYALRTYRMVIRHSTLRELARFVLAALLKNSCILLIVLCFESFSNSLLSTVLLDFLLTSFLLIAVRMAMIIAYEGMKHYMKRSSERQRVFIYGISDKSVALVTRLQNSIHYSIRGFLCYGKHQKNHIISEQRVFYFKNRENVEYLKSKYHFEAILFATPNEAQDEQSRLIEYALKSGLKILMAPTIDEVVDGNVLSKKIREIKIEDLLGRKEIKISMTQIENTFRGETILVTGAAGSIGSELVRQLASFGVGKLILFDNAETPVHNLRLELEEKFPKLDFVPVIGDVRMPARLDFVFRKYHPMYVFHAAAYKHVPLMEENPCEAVLVNVAGSRNVADKCIEYGAKKMVMISTDKAVNPTNIMGCTKRLAEIYVQSLGLAVERGEVKGETKFVTTRFGNVLGSNGSVIPHFREQIAAGGPVTVTHKDITRFFMTIPEACRLVMEAATMSTGNQIFAFDMGESVKIDHLARRMIELAGLVPDKDIEIRYTGLRPGEKLYEEVLSNAENTLPTLHERIRIAKVREYIYRDAYDVTLELERLSREVNIDTMVRLMKRTVPEFISNNSRFSAFDKK